MNLGNAARDPADPARAVGLHESALALAREHGATRTVLLCQLNLAVDHASLGEPDAAARWLQQTAEQARQVDEPRVLASVAALQALLLGSAEALAEARPLAAQSSELQALVTAAEGLQAARAGDLDTAGSARAALQESASRSQMARWAARWLQDHL
jgi:hypothetical protein